MYDRLIFGSGDSALRASWGEIAKIVRDDIAPKATVEVCRDSEQIEMVWRAAPQARTLIVVEAGLPPPPDAPSEGGGLPAAAALVARLREATRPPACIIVGTSDPKVMNLVQEGWQCCRLLALTAPHTADCVTEIKKYAVTLAEIRDDREKRGAGKATPAVAATPWALLEINLRDSRFSLQIGEGDQTRPIAESSFRLDARQLESIVAESRDLRKKMSKSLADPEEWRHYVSLWQQDYARLGAKVYNLINQDQFLFHWGQATLAAAENARIRFTLDNDAYDALWESIYDEKNNRWLMLNGIARRACHGQHPADGNLRALDPQSGNVRVLAIASDAGAISRFIGPDNQGFRNLKDQLWGEAAKHLDEDRRVRTGDVFPPLVNLEDELEMLRRLETAQKQGTTDPSFEVTVLRSDDQGDTRSLRDRVKHALTSRSFDVVHFAGHALFDEGKGRGYLIFGGADCTEAVPIAVFAGWLRKAKAQLAYLNCCRSSASRAAFELADRGVPLAIGFAWDLDTHGAVDFAGAFYTHLLEYDLKICQAFQRARSDLYEENQEDDPIWTAPVMVAQPAQWEKVETCFMRAN